MRYIKNYNTGKHLWTKPMKLPRTVRGQLAFSDDLHRKISTTPTTAMAVVPTGSARFRLQRGFRSAWRKASVTRRRANVRHGGIYG